MFKNIPQIKTRIRIVILFFMAALAISGATAMPVDTELTCLLKIVPPGSVLANFLGNVLNAITYTQNHFPFLLYGNDWLAFAHFVIAINFIGVLINPVKNVWVIQFGLLACMLVIPFALIVGGVRGLPLWWRFIDCSFGVFGALPLWYCYRRIRLLEKLIAQDKLNLIF